MNNKRGQALVEFVLILPILIFMLLAFIDIAKLYIMKNHLEGLLGDIKEDTKEIIDNEYDIKFTRSESENKITFELKSCLDDIVTPGLKKLLGDKACASTSKVIEKE